MKNLKLFAAAAVIATAGFASDSFAQTTADDVDASASVVIEQPISLSEDTSLDFATVLVDPDGGTITLAVDGTTPTQGSSSHVFSGTAQDGEFSLTGDANRALTITFTPGTLTGPGTAMAINNFTSNAGATPSTDGAGAFSFDVGADLVIGAGQLGGTYTGTYNVEVDYQ